VVTTSPRPLPQDALLTEDVGRRQYWGNWLTSC
jgi:hypothetical protein